MRVTFIVCALLFAGILNAANKESKKADKYFAAGDYLNAIDRYKAALETEENPSEKALYKYRIGVSYYRLNDVVLAEKNLSDAIKQGYMPADAYLMLGDVQLKLGKMDEAKSSYESYALANPGDNSIDIKIASVKFAKENQQNLSLFKLEPLGTRVNSRKNEFGVSYFNESLIFSSTRTTSSASASDEEEEEDAGRYSDRTIPEKKQKQAYTKEGLAKTSVWLATGSDGNYNSAKELQELSKMKDFSDDGTMTYDPYSKQAYYTRSDGKKAYIYSMQIVNNKWQKNEKIEVQSQGEPIGHPFINAEGDRIYFTSKMPGGKGKSDIWYISRVGDAWNSVPVNAGDNINTPGNEVYPHISDGYLFFASDGRIGMGGMDIYVAKITSSGFERPINLGTPFNSTADDYNLIMRLDKKEGMLVSSRSLKTGDDIYRFEGFPSNLTIVGTVKDENTGAPISNVSLELFIENKSLTKVMSDINGDFAIPVRPNTTYRLAASVAGYAPDEKTFTSLGDLFARISRESGINLDFNMKGNASVISGKVYDIETLSTLEGTTVILIADGVIQQTANVDPSGIYKFANLTSNTDYTVRVNPKGYFWDSREVRVANSSQKFEYNKANGHDLDFALQRFEVGKEIIISNIDFQEDKPNLLTNSYRELDRIADMFIRNPYCIILLKGYVDVAYKTDIAKNLSQYRVNEVRDYLVSKKVSPAQLIKPQGMGRQNPLVKNPISNDERKLNNRITYTVTRIDTQKELEYSRINVAPQTTAKPQTGTTKTGVTQQPATAQPTATKPTTAPPSQSQTQTQTTQPVTSRQTTQSQSSDGGIAVSDDGAYIVQIAALGVLDLKQPDFVKITTQLKLEVKYKLDAGKYKYFVGFFKTKTEADDVKDKLVKIGIKDAWARSKYQ
ncbi:MAG: carboxypeptidase regulatory-like domain-containing protein [Prevotellaceae bacterium]|jgi:peptidoglycan-associated lipoprotein|nr:carboxypeptidase regulatory-like domain-containing protein [Prevotellaceae bacterium]